MSHRTSAGLAALALTLPLLPAPLAGAAPAEGPASPAAATPAADPAPAAAAPSAAAPGLRVKETRTPELTQVSGRAHGKNRAKAAKAFLEARPNTFHIDPGSLRHDGTERSGRLGAERFEQVHRGVPVFGSGYSVRFAGDQVTGTAGSYYTDLDVDTTASLSRAVAERSLTQSLVRAGIRPDEVRAGELTVLPVEEGLLAYRMTASGVKVRTGEKVNLEGLVDAHRGTALAAHDAVQYAGEPVTGSGTTLDGSTVPLNLSTNAAGGYDFLDATKPMQGDIRTYDAQGALYSDFIGTLPEGTPLVSSDALRVPAAATASGAVDAHWAMGEVYDFFHDKLGRNSIDGQGMPMEAVVNVADSDGPYSNAFWDGQKMVFGTGDPTTEVPFAAGLDVVAHEMAHGVTTTTSDLLYFGQPGAVNEAYSDYFGAAVEAEVRGTSMDDPSISLIGEDLCRTVPERECAFRDIDSGATTYEDFEGVINDNAGVHINGPIYAEALWNLRKTLPVDVADELVYVTLTQYLSPMSDFVDGREATVQAARDMGLKGKQLRAVKRAFDEVGIVRNWEKKIGIDSRTLHEHVDYIFYGYVVLAQPTLAGKTWAVDEIDLTLEGSYGIFGGSPNSPKGSRLLSPDDGWAHEVPHTDGESLVWIATNADRSRFRVMHRDLRSGHVSQLLETDEFVSSVKVDGDRVALSVIDLEDFAFQGGEIRDGRVRWFEFPGGGWVTSLDLRGSDIAWAAETADSTGEIGTVWVMDLGTMESKIVSRPQRADGGWGRVGQIHLTDSAAVWVEDVDRDGYQAIMRVGEGGWGDDPQVLRAETGEDALFFPAIDANDSVVAYLDGRGSGSYRDEATPKLMQFRIGSDAPAVRMTCNRGEQASFALGDRSDAVWVDATVGAPTVEYRARAATRC